MKLRILLQPPARSENERPDEPQERQFEGVPYSTIEEITEDFRAYASDAAAGVQHELYRYHKNGNGTPEEEETLLALDFEEIVLIEAEPVRKHAHNDHDSGPQKTGGESSSLLRD